MNITMYSIELNGIELKKFLHYMAEVHDTYDNTHITNFMVSYKKKNKHKSLIYPSFDTFTWHHKDNTFQIKFLREGDVKSCHDGLEYFMRLIIYHEDLQIIKELLEQAFSYVSNVNDEGQVKLYVSKCSQYCALWETYNSVNVQTLDNIFIDKKLKDSIISYINKFINSKEKYDKFGRNYKTNLLLTGIPGSGKTSLCKALAKQYDYSIYIMNFNKSMTDSHFIDLMSEVKDNCIILYEDIDVYFTERTANDINISFSCLINVLDGTLSKGSGIINVITTNFPEKLDAAILRPGRIDKIIHFDYPKKEEIKDAFTALISEDDNFESFYAHIKHLKLSMASIIDYLFRYQDNYLDNIQELISQVRFVQTYTKEETSSKMYS